MPSSDGKKEDRDREDDKRGSSRHKKDKKKKIASNLSSLRFSAQDFVALSPDRFKEHYSVRESVHKGGETETSRSKRRRRRRNRSPPKQPRSKGDKLPHKSVHATSSSHSPHSDIYVCKERASGVKKAVKIVPKSSRWDHWRNERVKKEFDVLQKLDHPNIIRAYQFYEGSKDYYIVMDLCLGGDIAQELDAWGQLTEEKDAAQLIKSVLTALAYCHSKGVTHGNVKPEHILLYKDKDLEHLKLTDFSCCEQQQDDKNKNKDDNDGEEKEDYTIPPEQLGTPEYWAPEVVRKGSTSPKRDVWACGVLCHLLLSTQLPFQGRSQDEICHKIQKGKVSFSDPDKKDKKSKRYAEKAGMESSAFSWKNVSDQAKDFVQSLLVVEEKDRPSAEDALKHPWIQEMTREAAVSVKASANVMGNMIKFNADSKLKQAAMTFIGAQLILKEERKELDSIFRAMDTENNGKLSPAEVKAGYKEYFHYDMSDKEVKELFDQVDMDRSGYIEYSEFLCSCLDQKDLLHNKNLKQAFHLFDTDGSGSISRGELKDFLYSVKKKDLKSSRSRDRDKALDSLLLSADQDGDGRITFDEFVLFMASEGAEADDAKEEDPSNDAEKNKETDEDAEPPKNTAEASPPVEDDWFGGLLTAVGLQTEEPNANDKTMTSKSSEEKAGSGKSASAALEQQPAAEEDWLGGLMKAVGISGDDTNPSNDKRLTSSEEKAQPAEGNETPTTELSEQKPAAEEEDWFGGVKQMLGMVEEKPEVDPSILKDIQVSGLTRIGGRTTRPFGRFSMEYELGDVIARGKYGCVNFCLHRQMKALRAVKFMEKRLLLHANQEIFNEYILLRDLSHPNLLRFYDLYENDSSFLLVMENCYVSWHFRLIAQFYPTLSETDLQTIALQGDDLSVALDTVGDESRC